MSCGEGAPCLHSHEITRWKYQHLPRWSKTSRKANPRRPKIHADWCWRGDPLWGQIVVALNFCHSWSSSKESHHGECGTRRALDIFKNEFELLKDYRCAVCSYPQYGLANKLCLTCSRMLNIYIYILGLAMHAMPWTNKRLTLLRCWTVSPCLGWERDQAAGNGALD